MVFKWEFLNHHAIKFNLTIAISEEHNLHTDEMHEK